MHSNSERGGVLGAVLLALGLLVLLAMVGMVAGGLYIAHNVRVASTDGPHGGSVNIETPFGSIHVREDSKLDPKRLGVPVYPGALLQDDRHKLASVELSFGSDEPKELAIVAGEYTTTDSFEKVRDYYRNELPHWMVTEDRHGMVHFSLKEGGHKRIVAIRERGGTTHIALASVGESVAN